MTGNISMDWDNSLDLLLVHCQGEIGKVIVGGAPEIPGATMLDKMNHINMVDDSLRRFVTFEPRAGVAMSVNLLVAPTRPDADAGGGGATARTTMASLPSSPLLSVTVRRNTQRPSTEGSCRLVSACVPFGIITAGPLSRDHW